MLSHLFLGVSLLGAEWVLYFLLGISVLSIALIIERVLFYRNAMKGLAEIRAQIRQAALSQNWEQLNKTLQDRSKHSLDFETPLSTALVQHLNQKKEAQHSPEILGEIAHDAILRTKLVWEKHLALLATIGNNAPFVGLFGTVLGIIQAFHHLSEQTAAQGGVQSVTAALSEALIATGFGILVAIPAVVAFNMFQRKVRTAVSEAEALKSFLVGKLASR